MSQHEGDEVSEIKTKVIRPFWSVRPWTSPYLTLDPFKIRQEHLNLMGQLFSVGPCDLCLALLEVSEQVNKAQFEMK